MRQRVALPIKTAATEGEAGGSECERVTPFRTRNLAYRRYLKTGDWLPFGRLSLYSLICKHKIGGGCYAAVTTKKKADRANAFDSSAFFLWLWPLAGRLSCACCGERGIRTPGPVKVNGFQDRRNRPLCHLSEHTKVRPFFCFAKCFLFFFSHSPFFSCHSPKNDYLCIRCPLYALCRE